MDRLTALRRDRNGSAAVAALKELERTCRSEDDNIVPAVMAAVQSDVTIGEIGGVFRDAYGNWDPPFNF